MIERVTAALHPLAPAVGWASGALGDVQAADREITAATARRARAVAAFAASRPASADRGQGEPGAMSAERWAGRSEVLRPVSEWATQELAVALSLTSEAAQSLLERSLTLVHRLPGTLDALEAGVLHPGHLWPLLDKVAPIADDGLRAAVERDLLAWAAGRVTTPAQLNDKARREVLKRNARSAADDLARAVRQRGVSARPDRVDGMSVVSVLLTTPEAAALIAALGAYADALPADGRTRGQRMADCLLDLVLRPGDSGQPPVQVTLSVVAPIGALLDGDQPCEIDGHVVPAAVVRALLTALTGHRPTDTRADCTKADTADTDTADTDTADTDTADTDTADTDTEPVGSAPTAGEDDPLAGISAGEAASSAAEADALAAWWDRIERRLAAGEFDREPGPDDPDDPGPGSPGPDGSWPPDLDWPPDLLDVPPDEPDAPLPVPDGWWARADDAVTAASTALLTTQQALGHAHRLVATAVRADTADEAQWQAGPGGRITAAPDAVTALAAATDQARENLADLLARTAGGGLADRPRIVVSDALTGTLLALTDLPALHRATRDGTGLTPPAAADGHRPSAALDRHVRARDRRCRFPGCRRPVPKQGELDHAVPWPAGQTSAANLTGYCTGHHRGKHQAPGWRHSLVPDGTVTVSTPSGLTATTTPPPY